MVEFNLFLPLPLLLCLSLVATEPPQVRGFKLELIHRDSPNSPLYPGNLTESQAMARLISYSDARSLQLASEMLPSSEMRMVPPMRRMGYLYTVRISIGSPPISYHLVFDTSNELTWVQCVRCNPCFRQAPPLFDPTRSSTSSLLACRNPFRLHKCYHHKQPYAVDYSYGGTSRMTTEGFLYKDMFWFSDGLPVPGLTFGCSYASRGFERLFRGEIDGVMGMNKEHRSIAYQLGGSVSVSRFSYCLHESSTSYLRLGSDAVIREPNVVTTPFVHGPNPYYYLKLIDISLDGHRLGLPVETFGLRQDRTGGVVIDSGAPFTLLIRPAYDRVAAALGEYMERRRHERVNGAQHQQDTGLGLEHCWKGGEGLQLPTMSLHFEGGDLVVEKRNLFFFFLRSAPFQFFCLAMAPTDAITLLGVRQQQDTRFVFDVGRRRLQFAAARCAVESSPALM